MKPATRLELTSNLLSLFRHCSLLITLPTTQHNPNAPPTLPLAKIQRAAHHCSGTDAGGSGELADPFSSLDVECILSSLIDQGYIKGYTFHSKQLLVLQKGPLMGFVPVREVY